ncbi:MBL fold metallo-hydrolase [Dermabacter sp. p3-SID358]|uniref:MBL fold metallo-hydrolase n=1 Tax=Dermabacter sp. p3-SID358 TaxID=2916114 RepID=UPI0021A8F7FC|nr:MBL fold metallo-hydrolase [Dermabacter sp. p3-SID358]MCT1866771.1 MBL fold metallo-hydrolase [Dermabacter sp. p3-SID358]
MSIELTVVGCSGSYEGPGEPASAYLVTVPGKHGKPFRILMDCGSGALSNLHKVIDPSLIDIILISHLHADHFLDLAGLEVYLAYHPLVNCPTVRVFAPEGLDDRLSAATGNPDPIPPGASRAPYEFIPMSAGDSIEAGKGIITAVSVKHPVPAFGFRIEVGDSVLAYTGDTDSCEGVAALAEEADLLLCEAGYIEGRDDHFTGIHLTGKRAGILARQAGVKKLLLTHIPPWTDREVPLGEARAEFDGPLELAEALHTYTL